MNAPVVVNLRRRSRWFADWFGTPQLTSILRTGLDCTCTTSSGTAASHRFRPSSQTAEDLAGFLGKFRASGAIALNSEVDSALGALALPSAFLPSLATDLHLRGSIDDEPWLSGIPWELVTLNARTGFAGRLASWPIARRLRDCTGAVNSTGHGIRVLTCVALDPADRGIEPASFLQGCKRFLPAMSPAIKWTDATERDFAPAFGRLLAQINATKPNILVLCCHGQLDQGVPMLKFEQWERVEILGEQLQTTGSTFAVILLACDQAVISGGFRAQSGAITLLEKGVPAVVAMQNKIRADCAAWFLEAFLQGLIYDGRAESAVALGRRAIANRFPGERLLGALDWSYPGLFVSDNIVTLAGEFGRLPDKLSRLTWACAMAIPRAGFDLDRTIDAVACPALEPANHIAGRLWIHGAPGSGKSHWIRKRCRRVLVESIEQGAVMPRLILYIDLSRAVSTVKDMRSFYDELRRQASACRLPETMESPWDWPTLSGNGADDEITRARQVAEAIDLNECTVVFDNYEAVTACVPTEFPTLCQNLVRSLAVFVHPDPPGTGNHFPIGPLESAEIGRWLAAAKAPVNRADELLQATGGLASLVANSICVMITDVSQPIVTGSLPDEYLAWLQRTLAGEEFELLLILAQFTESISAVTVSGRLGGDQPLQRITELGLLYSEYRIEGKASERFVRITDALLRLLEERAGELLDQGASTLIDRFTQSMGNDVAAMADRFAEAVAQPGGRELIIAVQRAYWTEENWENMVHLMQGVEIPLFARSEHRTIVRLGQNIIDAAPEREDIPADIWITLGWARLKTGDLVGARECIDAIPQAVEPPTWPRRQQLLLAGYLKDSGSHQDEATIQRIYREIIETAQNEEGVEAAKDRALTHYNRALIRRHWNRDLPGALADLTAAHAIFEDLHDEFMVARCVCERAEVQIGTAEDRDFSRLLRDLLDAEQVFTRLRDLPMEAFAIYQQARLYRIHGRRAAGETRRALMQRARDEYLRTTVVASRDEVILERCAGALHAIEIALEELGERPDPAPLTRSLALLRFARGNAWAQRLLRDGYALRAKLQTNSEASIADLRQALEVAFAAPCHPQFGTDCKRAAQLLQRLGQILIELNRPGELDGLWAQYEDYIRFQLSANFNFDGTNHRDWIVALATATQGAHHG